MSKTLFFILGFTFLCCTTIEMEEQIEPDMMDAQSIKYLALGDSYTIGQGVAEDLNFPNQIRDSLMHLYDVDVVVDIIATTGWRTDELIDAIEKQKPEKGKYDFITLLIGVNNQYQGKPIDQFKNELQILIEEALEILDGNNERLILVSIPDYGVTPFGSSNAEVIAEEIDIYNEYKEQMAEKYDLKYIYITDLSREARNDLSLLAPDQLHPSEKLYAQWVNRILPELKIILGL